MHYKLPVKQIREVPHGSLYLRAKSVFPEHIVIDLKLYIVQHTKDVRETFLKDQLL